MLTIGTFLTLEATLEDKIEKYRCRVVEIEGDRLYIDYPVSSTTQRTVYLVDGTELEASFVEGDDSAVLSFQTEVLGRKLNKIPMIMLLLPPLESFIRIQRRQFVRVPEAIDVSLSLPSLGSQLHVLTEDISAGGCAIIVPPNVILPAQERGTLLLVLPVKGGNISYLKTKITIIRQWETENRMICSIQFDDLTQQNQQQLVRYCMEKQLERRNKGLADV